MKLRSSLLGCRVVFRIVYVRAEPEAAQLKCARIRGVPPES